jgi:hypothetical protein
MFTDHNPKAFFGISLYDMILPSNLASPNGLHMRWNSSVLSRHFWKNAPARERRIRCPLAADVRPRFALNKTTYSIFLRSYLFLKHSSQYIFPTLLKIVSALPSGADSPVGGVFPMMAINSPSCNWRLQSLH